MSEATSLCVIKPHNPALSPAVNIQFFENLLKCQAYKPLSGAVPGSGPQPDGQCLSRAWTQIWPWADPQAAGPKACWEAAAGWVSSITSCARSPCSESLGHLAKPSLIFFYGGVLGEEEKIPPHLRGCTGPLNICFWTATTNIHQLMFTK